VRVGDRVFHVQTEDRGPAHSKIDTAVYVQGRVVHRQSSHYAQTVGSQATDGERRHQVEEQHRHIIESLKAGTLLHSKQHAPGQDEIHSTHGISVTLANPASWISAGHADLHVSVRSRGQESAPIDNVRVVASLEGVTPEQNHEGATGPDGRVKIQFPLPSSGIVGATLVIRVSSSAGEDELRFHLRSKPKAPVTKK